MTPSKSKSIAQKGFILFSYTLYYTPLCPRFIPGESCEKDDQWYLQIKSPYDEYECEDRAPWDSFFADITGSTHRTHTREYLADDPGDSIATDEEEKK
jgi:hypothetical protein